MSRTLGGELPVRFGLVRISGVVIVFALWFLPRTARAQDALALAWSAPPGCPSRDEVVARVARLRPNLTRAASGLRATATVTPAARGRWQVRLRTEVHGDVGERALEGRTCALIADATAVVLALASDALPDGAPASDHPTLPESVVQVDDPESARPLPAAPPPPAPPSQHLVLGIDAAVDPLAFAGAAVALAVHGALERGALRVELALSQQLPATLAGARAGTGAEVLATTLTARACAVRARPVVSVGLCATATGGVMWATAFGLQRNDVAAWPWAAAGGGAALRVGARAGRIAVIARVEALANLTRPRFVVEGVGAAGEVAPVALWTSLGAEMRWP